MSPPRVLVVSLDRVDGEMAGAAIRAWELAHALSPSASVTLAAVKLGAGISSPGDVALVEFEAHSPRALRAHVMAADVIVAQPQWPVIAGWMDRSGARLIYDLYDPETLETLERFASDWAWKRRLMVAFTLDRLADALRGGHHFLCASEKQRDLWLGAMYAQRLIDPAAYDRDPSFRSVIDVVPFGLPATAPRRGGSDPIRAAFPGIGPGDEVVLWNGGIWPWLDAPLAVAAFARLRASRPSARLVFMGATANPAGRAAAAEARRAAAAAGLLDRSVFFNDAWVPYAARADWLLVADCALATHREHLETRFAFRTRLLDCFWTGLPIVCTAGDDLAARVERDGLGAAVPAGDDAALAAALAGVLDRGRAAYAGPLAAVAADFAWPRVAAPLIAFVAGASGDAGVAEAAGATGAAGTAGAARRPRRLGAGRGGPRRREAGHQLRTVAYRASHHWMQRAFACARGVRARLGR